MSDSLKPKTYGTHVSIDHFLETTPFPEGYKELLVVNHSVLAPAEARAWLQTQQVLGRKVYPMSSSCKKPCIQKNNGCSGFDYQGGGCPGFWSEPDANPSN